MYFRCAQPFGAVLASPDGVELLAARNASSNTGVRGGGADITRHAEMELIRKACAELTPEQRTSATLYTSTEPCVMCAGAIYWAGISTVVYGCSADALEDISGPGGFDIDIRRLYAQAKAGCRNMTVRGPCLEEEALRVHRESGCWANSEQTGKDEKQLGGDMASEEPNLASPDTGSVAATGGEVSEVALERSLLASGIGSAATKEGATVPTIDMSLPDEMVAEQMWKAANEVGFFTVINHGISKQSIDYIFDASKAFFSQSVKEKERQSPFDRSLNSGYEYYSQVRPSTGTTDQKESIQITAREGCMDGRWPSFPNSMRHVASTMSKEAHELACRIMTLLEPKACAHLKPGTLAGAHNLWGVDGQCTLRLLHYPPMRVDELKKLTQPGNVHWRAGAHTDWDCITLLFQRVGQSGLECRANPRAASGDGEGTNSSQWIAVPPIDGGIAVNIGDMLSRWSDGKLYSNLHRVRMPTEGECGSSRYSVAFFAQADKGVMIESQETDPITAGDYILSRIRSNYSS